MPVLGLALMGLAMLPPRTSVEASPLWHAVEQSDKASRDMPRASCKWVIDTPPPAGYSAPDGAHGASFFTFGAFVGFTASSTPNGPVDRIWVDWNRNRSFEKAEEAVADPGSIQGENPAAVFTFAVTPAGPDGPIRVRAATRYTQIIYTFYGAKDYYEPAAIEFIPTGYMAAEVNLGGKPATVGVVDANCDGAFDGEGDLLLFDQDGAGALEVQLPARSLIQSADGGFWTPKPARDGKRITFNPDQTALGEIQVRGCEASELRLLRGDTAVRLRPVGGRLRLPEGSYAIDYANLAMVDGAGGRWPYQVRGRKAGPLDVRPGAKAVYEAGGPFKLKVSAASEGPTWVFNLVLDNKAGDSTWALGNARGGSPEPPKLRVLDARGRELWASNFSYG